MEAGSNNKLAKGEIVECEGDPLEIVQYETETDPLALAEPTKVKCQSEVFDDEIKYEEFSYDEGSDERIEKCEEFFDGEVSDERIKKCKEFFDGEVSNERFKELSYGEASELRYKREIYKNEDYEDIVKNEHEVMESDGVRKRVKAGNSHREMLVLVEITKSSCNKNGISSSAEENMPHSVIKAAKILRPQCHQCRKVVFSKAALIPVVRLGVKKYECFSCEKHNLQLNSIIKQLHQCEACEKVFAKQRALAQHACISSPRSVPVPDHACDECDQVFRFKKDLNQHHVKVHLGVKFKCSYCPRGFRYKAHLNQHLALVHLRDRYKCNKCGEGFSYQRFLKQHSETMHSEDLDNSDSNKQITVAKQHKCNECNKIFSSKKHLLVHSVAKHTGSKKHKCDDCSELFSSKRRLSIHQGTVHSKA